MNRILLVTVNVCWLFQFCFSQVPVSHPDVIWEINEGFSDEFNASEIDQSKWNNDTNDWGTWSWEPERAFITDTVLTLRMVQDQHYRGDKEYYFTSGINRSREKITYGYFEAKIKATDKGQGTCPAFWLYSSGEPTPTEEGGVKYCEIDACEIFQIPNQLQRIEMNLHTRILENGVLVWKRPGQGHTELTHNTWVAPWDPRDDYHTYATWNRLDSIFWYVDGVQRGAKKNYYWHKPMFMTVSLGLRTPYERYINGERLAEYYPESAPEPGFPTEMYCDYVRAWNTPAQIYADREKYYDAELPLLDYLRFDVMYFAGNGESVLEEGWNGVTCTLQELTADNEVVNEIKLIKPSTIGTESGIIKFNFPMDGLLPSSDLPDGNQYFLKPAFRTSMNGGEDILLKEEYYPIKLVTPSDVNDVEAINKINISSSGTNISIDFQDVFGKSEIAIYDISGRLLYYTTKQQETIVIDNSEIDLSGIYLVSVKINGLQRVEKVALFER